MRVALLIGGLALGASFLLQVWAAQRADPAQQIDRQVRLAVVSTLFFYLLLGACLGAFCLRRRVSFIWVRTSPVEALLWGLPLGALGGVLAVLVNSAISGHLASDPNVELLVGGGGLLRIVLTLIITTLLAPLIEETIFRGILAGTLLAKGPAMAVWISAIGFAVWHMNPTSLRYYVFMGLLFATLWRKQGLVASMVAHAAFNGVLTLVAITATTGGAHYEKFHDVSFALPGGWHALPSSAPSGGRLTFQGPGGADLLVHFGIDPKQVVTTDQVERIMATAPVGAFGADVTLGAMRRLHLPAGEAVEAQIRLKGQRGHLLEVVVNGTDYEFIVVTGGSPAAEKGWNSLVRSVSTS